MDLNIEKRLNEFMEIKNKIIEGNNRRLETINKYIEVLKKCDLKESDNLETKIFKLYILLNSTQKVANYLNSLGYRIETDTFIGVRKFISTDITDTIKYNSNCVLDDDLKETVIKLQQNNSRGLGMKCFYE